MWTEKLLNTLSLHELGIVFSSLLLLWRLVKFTILPALRPDDPKVYPYWVPGLGHLKGFVSNSQDLLTRARLYFNDTKEPFALTLAGKKFYILTNYNDVQAAFRNSDSLSFEIFMEEMLQDLGVTKSAVESLYASADPARAIYPNPSGKPLGKLARDFHIHQIFPGNLLDETGAEFVKFFQQSLTIESFGEQRYGAKRGQDAVEVSLLEMTSDIFTNSAQDVYFGQLLRKIEPELAWIFLEFDGLAWQVLFRYPPFLSKKMIAARDKIFAALEKYYASPLEDRMDVIWFTPTLEKELRNLNVGNRDIAIMMMTIYWGIITNTRKGAFWMLAYTVFRPDLVDILREETAPAFKGETVDLDYIWNHCPQLRAVWDETLRMTAFSSSVRYVNKETVIGNKILRKGNRIMMPYRQVHLDSSIFGSDVEQFDSERFMKNERRRRHQMAFGGGSTQCPGRHLATQIIMVWVAMMLHRFDIDLPAGDRKFPEAEEANPVLGIIDVKCSDLSAILPDRIAYSDTTVYNSYLKTYWAEQESEIKPFCVISPQTTGDVSTAVRTLAYLNSKTNNSCPFAIRSGGHGKGGASNQARGVDIDLSNLNYTSLSADRKVASIGPGAQWSSVYLQLDPLNLTVPGGRDGDVGVGGTILGGGISYSSAEAGFSCDNVVSIEIVLSDGSVKNVSTARHPDLNKVLRGGSNNFGVVTRVDMNTLSLRKVWGGTIYYPLDTYGEQLEALYNFTADPNYDANAALFQAYGSNAAETAILNNFVYSNPTQTPPTTFEPFTNIAPQLASTIRESNLTDFVLEQATASPIGFRQATYTTTFKNHLPMLNVSFQIWNASVAQVTNVPGITWSWSFEPIVPAITSKSMPKGGNLLNLDPAEGPLMLCLLSASWSDSTDDALVTGVAAKVLADVEGTSKQFGVYHPFQYLGYAASTQDPLRGYGTENLRFMERVSKIYDRSQTFQYAVPGGFKLKNSHP
ncbi:MAG: hypothetical protein M1820_004428 [Bogoriella megaspora]|nr:MAG: hypothetical protein M1820_004428 [Bogoriella megaspora]